MEKYIFEATDQKKTPGKPMFLFSAKNKASVLTWINRNLADYFDGNRLEQEQKFKEFKKLVIQEGIAKGINTSTEIYARATEIKSIKEL